MRGKSRGAAGRDGSERPGCSGERCPRPCGSGLAALLSALAAASCLYLGVRTSDLQARLEAIEGARGGSSAAAAPLPPLPGFSLEQLNAMMQEKVERLLAQVCGTGRDGTRRGMLREGVLRAPVGSGEAGGAAPRAARGVGERKGWGEDGTEQ